MIRHIVLARLEPDLHGDEIDGVFAQLAALRGVLPGMRAFCAGPNVSPEGLARDFSHAFTADFEDAAARDAYLAHPDHQAAGARLVAATQGGTAGLIVVDVEWP